MGFDGVLADEEAAGDFAVAEANLWPYVSHLTQRRCARHEYCQVPRRRFCGYLLSFLLCSEVAHRIRHRSLHITYDAVVLEQQNARHSILGIYSRRNGPCSLAKFEEVLCH